jgi:ABC-type iron transport system FetAB ATPase subunit
MYYYSYYGLTVESDLDFFQLMELKHKPEQIDVFIYQSILGNRLEGELAGKSYSIGNQSTLFSNKTVYLVVEDGNTIKYQAKESANWQYLKTYLLGFGFAFLFIQKNQMAIHCSSVVCDKGALLLAGESGSGKSTLTRALIKEGFKLLADDMELVRVRGHNLFAYPAFPYQKMCRNEVEKLANPQEAIYVDEMKDKFMVPCFSVFEEQEQKVLGIVTLEASNCEQVQMEEVKGIEKLYAIYGNLFVRKLLRSEKTNPRIIDACLKIAATIPIYHLYRPVGVDSVEEQINAISKAFELNENYIHC